MEFFDNHKKLFTAAFLLFLLLTIFVAIMPAVHNQNNNAPLPDAVALSGDAEKGKSVYMSEGCVGCHTQQIRNVDMDRIWGERPSIAADYANNVRTDVWRNTATLMGTERTGPDLTNIGNRQPGKDWHLMHLFNPRIVVKESIMPAYPWLFTIKKNLLKSDVIVNVPAAFLNDTTEKVVATKEAIYLLAYLQSLKQTKLPTGGEAPEFLYKKTAQKSGAAIQPDGKALYTANCQSCHQPAGEGLPGAFPPLKGSPIVNGENLDLYVDIITHGYDARPEYGVMPAVGMNMNFTEQEVAAIINYERSSWGNTGKKVTPQEIKGILDVVKLKPSK